MFFAARSRCVSVPSRDEVCGNHACEKQLLRAIERCDGSKTYVSSDYENHIAHSPYHPADFDIEANCNPPSALQSLALYTDGSKGELGTGSAWCAMEGDYIIHSWAKKLHPSNSVFQAELTALKAALDFIANNGGYKVIYTDSMSSLQAIQGRRSRHPIVRDIQKLLISSPASLRPKVQWVPAHTGIKGNEAADLIAKGAANEPHVSSIVVPLPHSYLKTTLKCELMKQWQNYWDTSTTGRRLYDFQSEVNQNLNSCSSHLTQYLTGHGPYMSYLHRFRLRDSDQCICGSTGDPDHYVFDCPHTANSHLKRPAAINMPAWFKNTIKNKYALSRIRDCTTVAKSIADSLE
ncbi:Retrovirus-related Pol polyprotein from type-1 retrotransposable element R1, partial [Stegodyphus mimosarum]